jgi:hypothetical protein
MGLAAVGGARLPAGSPCRGLRRAFRERRRLPKARSPRGIEFVFEPIDPFAKAVPLAAKPIALPFDIPARAFKPLDLLLLPFEFFQQLFARCGLPAPLHTLVMPQPRSAYKYGILDLSRRERAAGTLTR